MSQPHHAWFREATYGMFIHWGPYAMWGRGEQVLFRERLDQADYSAQACRWNPRHYDARRWAEVAQQGGFRYAVLTTRHHDGFCLWDTKTTDYSSAVQAAKRDLVGEYVQAFRDAGLRVGLYYSLADWRLPAYWDGPDRDPAGFDRYIDYVHAQVEELLANYGRIDVMWFDGAWPHDAHRWRAEQLVERMRELQPELMINNRLNKATNSGQPEETNLGDFGTPEHHITADSGRMWESCNTSTWRLWGYIAGARWRSAAELLDMLVEAAGKGGNMLLNVGPDPDGVLPFEFVERARAVGDWLATHGECVYGVEPGDVCEFVTHGRQTRTGDNLYLICRFWDGRDDLTLAGLATKVRRATLLTTGEDLPFEQTTDHVVIRGLPTHPPTALFPVIRLECAGKPEARPWAVDRLWTGDPSRMTDWAKARGTSVWADGEER